MKIWDVSQPVLGGRKGGRARASTQSQQILRQPRFRCSEAGKPLRAQFNVVSIAYEVCAQSFQTRLTLCDPIDCSPPGSSVSGILQARILEWVAVPSSRGPSQPRDQTLVCLCLLNCRQIPYH